VADTILVTGGSGFIGSYLSKALVQRGDSVINFDSRPWNTALAWMLGAWKEEITFEQGSIGDWAHLLSVAAKHRVTKIAHLAAPIDTEMLNRRPKLAFDTIAVGAVNVLETVRLLDIKRLVLFSSIGILPCVQYEPIDGDHPTLMADEGPGSGAYGAGKLAAEAFCWAYRQSYNIDFVIIRPSATYGFGTRNHIYLNEMVEGAVRGEPVRFDHGREVPRDYVHVEDVVGIAVAALDAPQEKLQHRVFYAATGRPLITAGQVADVVGEMIPSADIQIQPGLSFVDRLEIRFRGVLDVKPVEEQLGYTIKYADIRAGIAELIARYRDYTQRTWVYLPSGENFREEIL
jgi:nucleoside-diphosphate-sugar epimerase